MQDQPTRVTSFSIKKAALALGTGFLLGRNRMLGIAAGAAALVAWKLTRRNSTQPENPIPVVEDCAPEPTVETCEPGIPEPVNFTAELPNSAEPAATAEEPVAAVVETPAGSVETTMGKIGPLVFSEECIKNLMGDALPPQSEPRTDGTAGGDSIVEVLGPAAGIPVPYVPWEGTSVTVESMPPAPVVEDRPDTPKISRPRVLGSAPMDDIAPLPVAEASLIEALRGPLPGTPKAASLDAALPGLSVTEQAQSTVDQALPSPAEADTIRCSPFSLAEALTVPMPRIESEQVVLPQRKASLEGTVETPKPKGSIILQKLVPVAPADK